MLWAFTLLGDVWKSVGIIIIIIIIIIIVFVIIISWIEMNF